MTMTELKVDDAKLNNLMRDYGVLVKTVENIEHAIDRLIAVNEKVEVLLERIANMESNTKESFIRVHDRIDSKDKEITQLQSQLKEYRDHNDAKCELIIPKAENGNKAYTGLIWFLTALGMLAIGTLYAKIWGDLK